MAYIPTFDDIPEEQKNYQPSLSDIPNEEDHPLNLLKKFKNMVGNAVPSLPPGINIGTGLMSLAFPGKQGDMVANLPQVVRGIQPTTSENVSQEVGKMLPGVEVGAPITKFVQGITNVLKQKNPKELAYGIQKAHDVLKNQASDIYDLVKNEVKPRGVNSINISKQILDEAEKHLPKDRASKLLIDNARNGEYEALHQLQSDLGKEGTRNLGSETYADRNIGKEMLDTREKINESIVNKFKENGHGDLSNLLDIAKDKWSKLKEIYYSHPTISKLVHEESRKVPKNPMATFTEESKPISRLLEYHPEIKESVEKYKNAKSFMKNLKTAGKVSAGFGAASIPLYGTYKLLDLLKGEG